MVQILGLLRPAQRRKRPQCGRKPGIQHILILSKVRRPALRADFRHLFCHYDFAALIAVISRDPVSPPELAADTPVADVVRPVKVDLFHSLRNQFDLALFHSFHRRLNQFVHLYKPLLFHKRFDGRAAPVMSSHIVLSAVFVDRGVIVHNIYDGKIMALPYLKVVGIMARGDLYHTCSEFHIHIVVLHDGNHLIYDGQQHLSVFQVCIALILRIDSHRRIAKHGLGTGGRKL